MLRTAEDRELWRKYVEATISSPLRPKKLWARVRVSVMYTYTTGWQTPWSCALMQTRKRVCITPPSAHGDSNPRQSAFKLTALINHVSRVSEHFWDHFSPTYIALTRAGNKLAHFNGSQNTRETIANYKYRQAFRHRANSARPLDTKKMSTQRQNSLMLSKETRH